MNPGGIRDRLRRGRLLARDVWNVMPFDNTVVVGKVKGKQLPASVIAGKTVEPEREYTLAINDFTAANQPTQLGAAGLVFTDTGKLLRDVIIAYIQKRQVLDLALGVRNLPGARIAIGL
jgi:2',3'-cyclic-nucleotide 2'-phosphodiesterase (5'-nucleotidase family)